MKYYEGVVRRIVDTRRGRRFFYFQECRDILFPQACEVIDQPHSQPHSEDNKSETIDVSQRNQQRGQGGDGADSDEAERQLAAFAVFIGLAADTDLVAV